MFREYLRSEFNIKDGKIGYLPQYADALFSKTVIDNKARKETIDLLFAGNVGAAQSMSTIFRAAYLLKDHPELRWHIVGDGSELENSKRMVQQMGLNNVIFYGRKPIEEIPGYYAKADAMLVTLTADKYISLTLPGKVQTYMAAGKPIIGAANGEISNTIETSRCGFCAKAEDARGLAEAVRTFLNYRDKDALGENARSYYQTHFTRDIFMDTLEAELKDYSK